MLFAADTREVSLDIDKDPSEIQRPPAFVVIRRIVDLRVTSAAHRTGPLQAFAQVNPDQDTELIVLAVKKLNVIDDKTIDI